MSGPKWATHDPPKSSNGYYTDFSAEIPLLKGQHRCKVTGKHLEAQDHYDPDTGGFYRTAMVLDPDPAAGRLSLMNMLWHDVHKLVRERTDHAERVEKMERELKEYRERERAWTEAVVAPPPKKD